MATVGETLFIALGLDASSAVDSLKQFQNNLQNTSNTAVNSAQKLENDTKNALQNVDNSAKNINNTLLQAEEQTKKAGSSFETMTSKWGGALKGLFTSILAPIAGAMTAGAVLKGYFSDVAQVAQMTGAYSTKMEEWRKKRNMLARVNKEDIELYKKIREGMFKFNESMANVSATIMRSISPAIKFLVGILDKFSNWLNANQNNIVRFIKILAVTISVALIPSLIRMGKALLMNPLTWIIATLGVLVLIIDDLITYINGGDSALSGLWSQFGTGEELGASLNGILSTMMSILSTLAEPLAVLGGGFTVFKIGQTLVMGLVSALGFLKTALTVITAHPIVAFITLIIGLIVGLIYWIKSAFERAKGDWGETLSVMLQDVMDFLNFFWGFGDFLKKVIKVTVDFFVLAFEKGVEVSINVFNTLKDFFVSFFEHLKNGFAVVSEFIKKVFATLVEIITALFSGDFTKVKQIIIDIFTSAFDKVKEVFKVVYDFIAEKIKALVGFVSDIPAKVKGAFGSATDNVKSFFGFGSDKDKEATKETTPNAKKEDKKSLFDFDSKNNAKELTEIATTSNVANNSYKNNVNKSVVQNINVDARGSEEQAGSFVASLTKDTDDYNNYSNNAQTAQF